MREYTFSELRESKLIFDRKPPAFGVIMTFITLFFLVIAVVFSAIAPRTFVVRASGVVVSENRANIMNRVSSNISEIRVVEGQRVNTGDVLMVFSDFQARLQIDQVTAMVELFEDRIEVMDRLIAFINDFQLDDPDTKENPFDNSLPNELNAFTQAQILIDHVLSREEEAEDGEFTQADLERERGTHLQPHFSEQRSTQEQIAELQSQIAQNRTRIANTERLIAFVRNFNFANADSATNPFNTNILGETAFYFQAQSFIDAARGQTDVNAALENLRNQTLAQNIQALETERSQLIGLERQFNTAIAGQIEAQSNVTLQEIRIANTQLLIAFVRGFSFEANADHTRVNPFNSGVVGEMSFFTQAQTFIEAVEAQHNFGGSIESVITQTVGQIIVTLEAEILQLSQLQRQVESAMEQVSEIQRQMDTVTVGIANTERLMAFVRGFNFSLPTGNPFNNTVLGEATFFFQAQDFIVSVNQQINAGAEGEALRSQALSQHLPTLESEVVRLQEIEQQLSIVTSQNAVVNRLIAFIEGYKLNVPSSQVNPFSVSRPNETDAYFQAQGFIDFVYEKETGGDQPFDQDALDDTKTQFLGQQIGARDDLQSQLIQNQAQLSAHVSGLEEFVVVAEICGVIHLTPGLTVGTMLQAGTLLGSISTDDYVDLLFEAIISSQDRAKIAVGDRVETAISGVMQQEFGIIVGEVIHIDSDATRTEDGQVFFRITIAPEQTYLTDRSGRRVDIVSGMVAESRVQYDETTWLVWVLEQVFGRFR